MTGEHDIVQAVRYYTNKEIPGGAPPWVSVQRWLNAYSQYDAYQYCWYIGCVSGMGWQSVIRPNVMNSDKHKANFLEWKSTRVNKVRQIVKDSFESMEALINSGVDITRVLTNDVPSFNAIVRIERALRERHNTGGAYNIKPVYDKWRISAQEKLLGDPEYLPWCPHLNREFENKGEIYRGLVPDRG